MVLVAVVLALGTFGFGYGDPFLRAGSVLVIAQTSICAVVVLCRLRFPQSLKWTLIGMSVVAIAIMGTGAVIGLLS